MDISLIHEHTLNVKKFIRSQAIFIHKERNLLQREIIFSKKYFENE